jgi:hypothetical protein
MSIKYTPTAEWAAVGYSIARNNQGVTHEEAEAEFDRFLAARDAEQQRIGAVKALREAADAILIAKAVNGLGGVSGRNIDPNGDCSVWLFAEAGRIEQESKTDER